MNGYINTVNGLLAIQPLLIQVLESSYVVETSNVPLTVIGRCKLLKDELPWLLESRNQPEFPLEMQQALDSYRQMYYDKPISEIQLSILLASQEQHYQIFFFANIERSLYKYIDQQLKETSLLKKENAKEKRIEKLHKSINDCNTQMLSLYFSIKIENPYFDKISALNKTITNLVDLKVNSFDDYFVIQVNKTDYKDENKAPISDSARKLIKEIKAKLWMIQFEIINQNYKMNLMVNGNNVSLSFDEHVDGELQQKIKIACSDNRLM